MWGYWGSVPTNIPTTHPLILGFNEPDHENQVRIRIKQKRKNLLITMEKHCKKNYANEGDGNSAVLNTTIFLTQANMSFEYDNFLTQANMSPERALEGWLLLQEAYPDK